MAEKAKVIAMAVLLLAMYGARGYGQAPPPAILIVDVENLVQYSLDTADLSKFATDPNATIPTTLKNFGFNVSVGDIVAVNGQPVKGTLTRNARQIPLNTAP